MFIYGKGSSGAEVATEALSAIKYWDFSAVGILR